MDKIKTKKEQERDEEFEKMKSEISKIMDFSGSDEEISGLMQVVDRWVVKFGVDSRKTPAKRFLMFNRIILGTNKKTGDDTVNFDICPSLTCNECKNGHCTIQTKPLFVDGIRKETEIKCYGLRDDNQYPTKLLKSVINYIVFNRLSIDELINQVTEYIEKHNVHNLRFNETGCFYSLEAFAKCDIIASAVINSVIPYSYTSNIKLLKMVQKLSNIQLNLSNKEMEGVKTTKTIEPTRKAIMEAYHDPTMRLCVGNCSACPYCKDDRVELTTVFVDHDKGSNLKLEDVLTPKQMKRLKMEAYIENLKYMASYFESKLE
jgi:hypothetical protein